MTQKVDVVTKAAPKREGITTGALRTFVAIAETGSFSRAAAQLGVAQPTVSIQLNNLEQGCGVPLLYRRPRISLTEAGKGLFIRARQILSRLEELETYTNDLKALERGSLSVGTSTPVFAMPLLASFMQAQPAIGIQARIGNTSALLEAIAQCQVDVAVMTLDQPVPSLHCTLIASQRLTVCVPADSEWAGRQNMHVAELAEQPLILREEGSMTRRLLESAFGEKSHVPRVRLEAGSREAVKEAVAAGLGVGVLMEGELRGDCRLAALSLVGTAVVGGLYAASLKEAADIPAVGAFLAHVATVNPLSS